ncbi:glycosyltransferase family 9 protein, partial [Campylobacter jejuni]|nr:glycosyltransferase family 9 protein [Campylobacter jejuni]
LSLTSFMLNTDFNAKNLAFKQDIFSVDENLKQLLNNKLKLDKNEKNILIHVGSSVENKIYPKTKLAILCKLLINEFQQAKIWLAWGNVKEYEFAKEILNLSDIDETHIELAPKFNLEELMAFTKMMNLIIGNDSGPTHLAFALNKASITIFGATPSYRNAFQTHINKIIDAGKKIQNAKHIDKSDFCITRIEEEDIFKLAKGLLNEK